MVFRSSSVCTVAIRTSQRTRLLFIINTNHINMRRSSRKVSAIIFRQQISAKLPNMKLDEDSCSGSRTVPYGQTDGQTDTRLIAAAL